MKLFFMMFIFCVQLIQAQKVTSYEEVFIFLESNGIVIGRDVSHDNLYLYLQDNTVNTQDGIGVNVLYTKIIQNQTKIDSSIEQEKEIEKEYNLNTEKATDKEVLNYLKEKNEIFDLEKENREKLKNKDENKSWFSEKLDQILEKIKF